MTSQVFEALFYDALSKDQSFTILGLSNGQPYIPGMSGLNPISASSACWSGYSASYGVINNTLCLQHLFINHSEDSITPSTMPPPPINNTEAQLSDVPHIGAWMYSNIELPLDYSGGIIIAKDFLYQYGQPTISEPIWQHESVHELIFKKGILYEDNNMNSIAEEYRKRKKSVKSFFDPQELDNLSWFYSNFKERYFR